MTVVHMVFSDQLTSFPERQTWRTLTLDGLVSQQTTELYNAVQVAKRILA